MKKLLLLCVVLTSSLLQAQWTQVWVSGQGSFGTPNGPGKDQGWNRMFFVHDLGLILTDGYEGNQTTDGTLCNEANPTLPCSNQLNGTTLFSPFSEGIAYTKSQMANSTTPGSYGTSPPFAEFYTVGITAPPVLAGAGSGSFTQGNTSEQGRAMWLQTNIGATDTTLTLCGMANCTTAGQVTLQPIGTIWLDDEVIDYSNCSAVDSSNLPVACTASTAVKYTLTVASDCYDGTNGKPNGHAPCRGQRTNAGWTGATGHQANLGATGFSFGRAMYTSPKSYQANGTPLFGARFNVNLLNGTGWQATPVNNFIYGGNQPSTQFDGPMDRHPVGGDVYDCRRGRLWKTGGFQENISMHDTWTMALEVPKSTSCGPTVTVSPITGNVNPLFNSVTASDLPGTGTFKGWQHLNLSNNPLAPASACPGGLTSCVLPNNYSENDWIYDPWDDLIYEVGGLSSGATDDAWVWCLSAPGGVSSNVPACHNGGVLTGAYIQGAWLPVCNNNTGAVGSTGFKCQGNPGTPSTSLTSFVTCSVATGSPDGTCHGRPGIRDGVRLALDPVDKVILLVGGRTNTPDCGVSGTICWTSIAAWIPTTNDYCLSDTSQGTAGAPEFNGAGCATEVPSKNLVSGPRPAVFRSMYFPDVAWDTNPSVNALMLYKYDEASSTTSGLYEYTPSNNTWSRTSIVGTQPPAEFNQLSSEAGKTMVYDDVNQVLFLEQLGTPVSALNLVIFELSDSALGGTAPVAPGGVTGLTVTAGNLQNQLTWTDPTTGGTPTSYNIFRCTGTGCSPTLFTSLTGSSVTSFLNTGLTNGILYCYQVNAVNGAGAGPLSTTQCATPFSGPEGTPSPLTLSFGNINLGNTSLPKSVTFTSSGGSTLSGNATSCSAGITITITGDFAQTNNCPVSLTIGSSCTVNVTFSPSQPTLRIGTLSFCDNAADSPQAVSLTGSGATPHPNFIFGKVIRR